MRSKLAKSDVLCPKNDYNKAVTTTRTGPNLSHTEQTIRTQLLTTRLVRSLASDMTQVSSSVLDILVNKIERVLFLSEIERVPLNKIERVPFLNPKTWTYDP